MLGLAGVDNVRNVPCADRRQNRDELVSRACAFKSEHLIKYCILTFDTSVTEVDSVRYTPSHERIDESRLTEIIDAVLPKSTANPGARLWPGREAVILCNVKYYIPHTQYRLHIQLYNCTCTTFSQSSVLPVELLNIETLNTVSTKCNVYFIFIIMLFTCSLIVELIFLHEIYDIVLTFIV